MFGCGIVRVQEADDQELRVVGGSDQGSRSSRARKSRKQREGTAERPRSEATHSGVRRHLAVDSDMKELRLFQRSSRVLKMYPLCRYEGT
jgi:hypothetical protein